SLVKRMNALKPVIKYRSHLAAHTMSAWRKWRVTRQRAHRHFINPRHLRLRARASSQHSEPSLSQRVGSRPVKGRANYFRGGDKPWDEYLMRFSARIKMVISQASMIHALLKMAR